MTKDAEVKDGQLYSKEHEWVRVESQRATVGITAFAVEQLGDVTLVNWDVEEGDTVKEGEVFGTVESVKALSDLFAPLSGVVKKLNGALEEAPELLNDDCWDQGWMVVLEPTKPAELEGLLSAEDYRHFVAAQDS